jgi:hypothetical protein
VNESLLCEFAHPGSQYRGAPFWAWNGRLEPEELRRQVRLMQRMGLGGFFMHSRVGLATPYLGEEWFACVNACIDEAERLGMRAWLYDEDRWPSGAAGGLVTRDPRYRMRSLVMEELPSPKGLVWDRSTLAAFRAKVSGSTATHVQRLRRGSRPRKLAEGESILLFRVRVQEPSSWYNGYTYLDTLSHEAVREFIRVTHEAYRKRCGKYFGKTVPGIFTDEPNTGGMMVGHGPNAVAVPWTENLPAEFRRRYGYSPLGHLPEVFLDVEGRAVTPARYHFHDCVTHLFVDAFSRQIGEWCGRHGVQFTGHALYEETLSHQTNCVGSALRFYEHMQAPGMDILTEHRREYDTAKQVSSVARQFGRRWRLTETYGCTGWDFPFAGHKAIGDWQAAFGINLRCPHLSWYTMEGEAKRDYPASIFTQTPWWELYPKVEDYFARLNLVLTRGREVRDLLVIHPVESMWLLCRKGWHRDPETEACDRMLVDLRDSFLAANIDFDYGDEDILARHGRVTKRAGRAQLVVGRATYKAVVVPPLLTVRRTTLSLLERFRAAGGTVVFAGKPAGYVEAKPSADAERLARRCLRAPAKGQRLVAAVERTCRRVSIADAEGREIAPALHLLREDRDAFYLFVCNVGHDFARGDLGVVRDRPVRDRTLAFPDVRIRGFGDCAGAPIELDAQTGQVFAAGAQRSQGGWEIRTSLPALGSRLFVIPRRRVPTQWARRLPPRRRSLADVRRRKLAPARWDIILSESNVLVLDRPRYRVGAGPWRRAEEILRVDRAVRDALGIPRRGGSMVQPWAREKPARLKGVPVTLAYSFVAKAQPTGDLFLALEQPKRYSVAVNGVPISTDMDAGWWTDLSLRKLPVDPALIRVGANEVVLTTSYDEAHSGFEIVDLLGTFGTRVTGAAAEVTASPKSLRLGDWVKQGLAFYSGSVSYGAAINPRLKKGERLFVHVPAYRGVAVRVLVDGRSAGIIAWEPNEVDITDLVGEGAARLRLEVIGHRRNSHGPLHHAEKWPYWTGPAQFVTSGDQWVDGYQLVPCGLMEPPELVVRK